MPETPIAGVASRLVGPGIGPRLFLNSLNVKIRASLSAKLISGFLLVVIPSLAVVVAISLYALHNLSNVTRQLQEISRSLEAVERLETALARTVKPLSAHLVDKTPGEEGRFQSSMREVEGILKSCGAATCHGSARQPQAMIEALVPYIRDLNEGASMIFGASKTSDEDKFRVLHEINRQSEETGERLNYMSSTLVQQVASLENEWQQTNQRAATLIMTSVFIVLAFAALTAYGLSSRLLRQINGLLAGTRQIMQGNLDHRVALTEPDEIGQLAKSFNAMAQEIQLHREHLQRIVDEKTVELKLAQDSLIQSEKLASIGLLASGVAHELNNPLTSILMNVSLLTEDAGDQPALKTELQRIYEDTVRCKGIIDDLRDFSRRQDLDLVPTNLNRLAKDALALVSRRKEFERIGVSTQFAATIPQVPCDPARMEQVLINVFVNAAQAMPAGGVLTVETRLRDGFAEISVRDTGSGIPREIRSKIFDPFFTTKPHGTGLGLSIVYRIMEAHAGRVELAGIAQEGGSEGEAGQVGTEVVLLLPLEAKGQVNAAADN